MQTGTLAAPQIPEAAYSKWLELDVLPDWLIRIGIRRLLSKRLEEEAQGGPEAQAQKLMRFIEHLRASPIAIGTAVANQQHYEVPPEFYRYVLGPQLKYSCALWPDGVNTLEGAEAAMLELTCQRARLEDGLDILELGCGWGSLSLYMAERYPNSRILAVSNSRSQRRFIDSEAIRRGLMNLEVVTADMNAVVGVLAGGDVLHHPNWHRGVEIMVGAGEAGEADPRRAGGQLLAGGDRRPVIRFALQDGKGRGGRPG